jgi:chemotaxis protein MotD
MADISVSEAPSMARPGRQTTKGSDAGGGGFSDVLNKASGGPGTEPGGQAESTSTTGTEAGSAHRRPTAKPLIDLSDASLAAQAEAGSKTGLMPKDALKTGSDEIKSGSKHQANDRQDGSDKLGDEVAAHISKSVKPSKGQDNDAKDEVVDDSAASDVLSLLKQLPADGATAAAAIALSGQKTDPKAPADPKDKSDMGAKTKDGTIADVSKSLSVKDGSAADAEMPGADTVDGADARTFRLSRADGKSQSMDMHLGIEKDAAAEPAGKANVENIAVLDSRRYIGLAQNTNSAAVTAAISGDSEWAHAMQASSALSNAAEWTSTGKVVNTLKIQMNPIDLGLVTATMRLQGDALNVDLKVETGAAYRQLKEDHSKILEALRSQGYTIENVTISMAPVERSEASAQQGAQGQQAFAQQGQGGEARERQNQSGQRSAGGFNDAGEIAVDGASSSSGGSGSGSDVYL